MKSIENAEAVYDVLDNINDIGVISNSAESKEAIEAAKASYDALTPEQKALLDEDYVEALLNSVAVQEAINEFNEIGDITLDDKTAIEEARAAYEALTDEQKALFPAETLKSIENAEAVYDVLDKIYGIGTVKYDTTSEAKIADARAAYEALTDEQKAMVNEEAYAKLISSEKSYQDMHTAGNAVSITFLVISSLALVGGAVLLFFLLKGLKRNNGVRVNSLGLGLSTLVVLTSHYADAQFIVLYIIGALAIAVWIAVLVVFLKKKQMKKALSEKETKEDNANQ